MKETFAVKCQGTQESPARVPKSYKRTPKGNPQGTKRVPRGYQEVKWPFMQAYSIACAHSAGPEEGLAGMVACFIDLLVNIYVLGDFWIVLEMLVLVNISVLGT